MQVATAPIASRTLPVRSCSERLGTDVALTVVLLDPLAWVLIRTERLEAIS